MKSGKLKSGMRTVADTLASVAHGRESCDLILLPQAFSRRLFSRKISEQPSRFLRIISNHSFHWWAWEHNSSDHNNNLNNNLKPIKTMIKKKFQNQSTSLVILFTVALAIFSQMQIHAQDFKFNGVYYDIIGDSEVAVTGNFPQNDYSGDIVIPGSVTNNGKTYIVTTIGGWAFVNCPSVTSVTIPNTITTIESCIFKGCSLTTFNIPSSVTYINSNAFQGCETLSEITVDAGNTNYASSNGCIFNKNLTDLIIVPKGITGEYNIPNSVTSIGQSAFRDCYSLTTINIPNSVTSIGQSAFSGCSSLASINIPSSVTSIGESAFSDCSSLESINIPNSITAIRYWTFGGCSSLNSVILPNSITEIESYAFYACSSLVSIDIPNSVNSIQYSTFSYCMSLTSINIPNSVTSISSFAFEKCYSLESITIPNSVTKIDYGIFYNCSSLSSVTCLATEPPYIDNPFLGYSSKAVLYVPENSVDAYMASSWNEYFSLILGIDLGGIIEVEGKGKVFVRKDGNTIEILNLEEGETISIYNINGVCEYLGNNHTVTLNTNNVYILRTKKETLKFAL